MRGEVRKRKKGRGDEKGREEKGKERRKEERTVEERRREERGEETRKFVIPVRADVETFKM